MMFEFNQPETLQEALATLDKRGEDTKVLAGGTALVLMLQNRLIDPKYLMSLGKLTELNYIRSDGDGLHIGAMTPLRDIEISRLVREEAPLLAAACGVVGNVRVRNQATLGGNLAEADYASDPPAALMALNANVSLAHHSGTREIAVSDFFLGFFTTVLAANEMIIEILIRVQAKNHRSVYHKFKSRSSEDRACVGVAALANIEDGVCVDLRVAVGAASETPQRLSSIEQLAVGKSLSEGIVSEIANGYAETIETLEDMRGSAWYRSEMIRVHIRKVLEEIANGHW